MIGRLRLRGSCLTSVEEDLRIRGYQYKEPMNYSRIDDKAKLCSILEEAIPI